MPTISAWTKLLQRKNNVVRSLSTTCDFQLPPTPGLLACFFQHYWRLCYLIYYWKYYHYYSADYTTTYQFGLYSGYTTTSTQNRTPPKTQNEVSESKIREEPPKMVPISPIFATCIYIDMYMFRCFANWDYGSDEKYSPNVPSSAVIHRLHVCSFIDPRRNTCWVLKLLHFSLKVSAIFWWRM